MPNAEFAILCPIAEEWESVCKTFKLVEDPRDQRRPTKIGSVANCRVVCVLAGKGEGNTAVCVEYTLQTWRPRWLILVGIAGGFPQHGVRRGDVVVARFVYNFEFGKLTAGGFHRRPDYDFGPDQTLLSFAEIVMQDVDAAWKAHIVVARPDGQGPEATNARDGYVASSSKVVDDPNHSFFQSVMSTFSEIHAVEMEASGAGAAIALKSAHQCAFLMIRGISDEPTCDDDPRSGSLQRQSWKHYAAAAASAFAYRVVETVARSAGNRRTTARQARRAEVQPMSPEALAEDIRSAVGAQAKNVRVALLHDDNFPRQYLDRLIALLRAYSVTIICPSLEHRTYSYAEAIHDSIRACSHVVFIARFGGSLTTGWADYVRVQSTKGRKKFLPRIATN